MTHIMRQSVHISIQAMKYADPDCLELLYLLALLPGGILAKDLDTIWKAYKEGRMSDADENLNSPTTNTEKSVNEFFQNCKWG